MRPSSFFAASFLAGFVSVAIGCGGSSSDAPAEMGGTDAGDSSVRDSSATDVTTDTSVPVEVGADVKPGCPGFEPSEGMACDAPGVSCDSPNFDCGGTVTATCTDGKWHVVRPKCLSEYCPERSPPTGSCSTENQICRYWPDFDAAATSCAEFKCTAGAWVDTHTTTCFATRDTCKSGTPCTSPSGCALGHCNLYCLCGVDGVLHCTAHVC